MGRSTLNPWWSDTRVHHHTWVPGSASACQQRLSPYLKVYDDSKDEHCGDQVHEVGQVLPVEGFPQSSHFVRPSGQKMEESDDGSLEFCAWE